MGLDPRGARMNDLSVAEGLSIRGVSRLTHFTSSRNLPKIIQSGAILSTADLVSLGLDHVATDAARFDGHPGHICCNIEYPNMFYFDHASEREQYVNYSDWIVFLLAPAVATAQGVLFSPVNAALGRGKFLESGAEGLAAQYAAAVNGRSRAARHNPASPTDVQAEVLVPGRIPLSEVRGIVVPSEETLHREHARLSQLNLMRADLDWYISPEMFRKYAVTDAVRGARPISLQGPFRSEESEQ